MKIKKTGVAILLVIMMAMSTTLAAFAFTHEADAWDYGVQTKGIDFIWLDRVSRTYSTFFCPSQNHHATAVMDSESVRVDKGPGYSASAYTNYYDSFSSTHAYYGHD